MKLFIYSSVHLFLFGGCYELKFSCKLFDEKKCLGLHEILIDGQEFSLYRLSHL